MSSSLSAFQDAAPLKRASLWASACFPGGIIKSPWLNSPLYLISLVNSCPGLSSHHWYSNQPVFGAKLLPGPGASCSLGCWDLCLHGAGAACLLSDESSKSLNQPTFLTVFTSHVELPNVTLNFHLLMTVIYIR